MSQDTIDYHQLMQAAMRDVVRRTLAIVAEEGLPPGHFFYVTFVTQAPGVELAPELQARYPDEMTIIIQNQFWGLEVDDEGFAVGLSFSSVPHTLRVPFSAVVSFVDPPAEFGLRFAAPPGFEAEEPRRAKDAGDEPAPEPAPEPAAASTPRTGGKVVSLEDFRKK